MYDDASIEPAVKRRRKQRSPIQEGPLTKLALLVVAIGFLVVMVIAPLIVVFVEAFARGLGTYFAALAEPDTISALQLTLLVAAVSVPMNLVFGVAAAWVVAKFDFKGKALLLSLIDLPFAVSPVVAGLIFVLLFGASSPVGVWFADNGFPILFAPPGIILATTFITFPFIARELIPLMQQQGTAEEEAALSLGAGGWRTFFLVTLPNVKWGLLYGVLLCNARAMGEFGAVSVVSGSVRGQTMTLPLHVKALNDSTQIAASFAVASLLAMLALITLAAKTILESRFGDELAATRRH
jgi:sulfate transport system permease protein